jgi:serine/threonine kinase PknH
MTAEFSKDPVFRERMEREARITGRLREPHVVPIHDYGEVDGQLFLNMRLIEGTDLGRSLKRFGPLSPPCAVAIIIQVASALDAAHAAGVMLEQRAAGHVEQSADPRVRARRRKTARTQP